MVDPDSGILDAGTSILGFDSVHSILYLAPWIQDPRGCWILDPASGIMPRLPELTTLIWSVFLQTSNLLDSRMAIIVRMLGYIYQPAILLSHSQYSWSERACSQAYSDNSRKK